MTFAEQLYNLPTDRLRAIFARRAVKLRGAPRLVTKHDLALFLSSALSQQTSIEHGLSKTNLLEIRVLIALVSQGGDMSFEDLVQMAGEASRGRCERAVDGLESAGLVFWTGDKLLDQRRVLIPKSVQDATPLPAPLKYRLSSSLQRFDAQSVQRIADNLGVAVTGANRNSVANAIIQHLGAQDFVKSLLERLSNAARSTFEDLMQTGGVCTLYEMALKMDSRQRHKILGSGWLQNWMVGRHSNGPEELVAHGLAVCENSMGWGQWRMVIPSDVIAAYAGKTPYGEVAPAEPAFTTISANPAEVNRCNTLIRDVCFLLAFVSRADVVCTSTGNMHRNALKVLAKGLSQSAPGYADLVYSICRDAGLISPEGRKNLYQITPKARKWLKLNAESQLAALYVAWRSNTSWAEAFAEPLDDGKSYRRFADVDIYRDAAVLLLSDLAREHPDEFATIDSLVSIAEFRWWHRFAFHDYRADAQQASEHVRTNRHLLERLFAVSLFALGLTETLRDAKGHVTHTRFSKHGIRRFLGQGFTITNDLEVASKLSVLPNLEIFTPINLAPELLYRAYCLGEAELNGMIKLSRESLRRAFDRGESSQSILQFLREHSDKPLPQNVEYLVNEVGGKHGHIRVGHAGLFIQVSDPLMIEELKAHKGLKMKFRGQIADTVALITGDSVDDILRRLRQAGYSPVSVEERDPRRIASQFEGEELDSYDPLEADAALSARLAAGDSAPDFESKINWEAFAKEDGHPWRERPAPVTHQAGVTRPKPIREMIEIAIRNQLCVQILYRDNSGEITERVIEPELLSAAIVSAWCRLRNDRRHFNLHSIQSARLTGERANTDEIKSGQR